MSLKYVGWERVNSLPNNKILDMSKLKVFADDKINVTQKLKLAFGRVENIVGKGENAGYQHFLLSYIVFKTLLSQGHCKSGLCDKELKQISIFGSHLFRHIFSLGRVNSSQMTKF